MDILSKIKNQSWSRFFSGIKKALLIKYISVLLICILVPSLAGYVISSVSFDSALEQVKTKNNQTIINIQKTVDFEIEKIMQSALSVTANQRLAELAKRPYTADFHYEVYNNDFFPPASSCVYKWFLYLGNSDIFIKGSAFYQAESFLEDVLIIKDTDTAYLYNTIRDAQTRTFLPVREITEKGHTVSKEAIMFIQPFPTYTDSSGKVIALIDCQALIASFADKIPDRDACFIITDSNGLPIYSVGNSRYVTNALPTYNSSHGTDTLDGENIYYFTRNSALGSLKYTYIENDHSVKSAVSLIQIITVLYVLICLAAGIIIIMRLVRKRRAKEDGKGYDISTDGDESSFLKLDNLINDKRITPIFETGEATLKKSVISDIVHGEFINVNALLKDCEKHGISFISEWFCVVYFNLNEVVKSDMPIIKYAISNTVCELFAPISEVYIDDSDMTSLVCLVNLKRSDANSEKQILEHLKFLRGFFMEQFAVPIHTGAGNTVSGVENVSVSFSNAKNLAQSEAFIGAADILSQQRIKAKDYYYFYPLETESKLFSYVINSDKERVHAIIDHILEANSELSLDMSRCLAFDMTATALKILSNKSLDISAVFDDAGFPFACIMQCNSIEELSDTIHDIFEKISTQITDNHSVKKEKFKSSVTEFVKNNYSNPSMSLAMVADEFSMNYTYMSHFFKDIIGMNFIDYISDLRIKKASELLRNTNMSISDIAVQVGYANATVLIKIFKKVMQTTPGAYRKDMKK